MTINKIFLCGRLAKDPEIRELSPEVHVCKFTIVTDYLYKNKDNKDVKETCFLECSVWNKQAKHCAANLKKGSLVTVEGRMKQENWVDKDSGKERIKHVVAVNAVIFTESKITPSIRVEEPIQEDPMLELPF